MTSVSELSVSNFSVSNLSGPRVSVIIPAYNSHETIAGTLEALRQQTFSDFEVIVIDSGPSNRSQEIVEENYPEVRFFRITSQLPAQAARDYGSYYARGDLLIFTDPDIYPAANWLERMVDAHARFGNVIVGAIDCFGSTWLDVGIHLCKFYICLPGVTSIEVSPSGNMLCSRSLFRAIGGFDTYETQGDVSLSWRLLDDGYSLHFVPDAIVYHHHTMTWPMFLKERYVRGKAYAALRTDREMWDDAQVFSYGLITVIPIRLTSLTFERGGQCLEGKQIGRLSMDAACVCGGTSDVAGR